MNKKEQQGCVYILTNPSFHKDWIKIGKSSRPVDVRSKELDNTSVPLPFEIFAIMRTSKYNEVEKNVHKQIDRFTDLRIRQNREFFNVEPQIALDIFKDLAKVIDDAEIILYKDGKPFNSKESSDSTDVNVSDEIKAAEEPMEKRKIRSHFKFSMCGIKIGEEIVFNPTGLVVKVASDDSIEYEGRIYKLSPFVGTFIPDEKRCPSDKYGGPMFFSYKGKTLYKLRIEKENEHLEGIETTGNE